MTSYTYLGHTVGILLTFCCGTCDVFTLVGMTIPNIYTLFKCYNIKGCKVILSLYRLLFITKHHFCKVGRLK